MLSPKVTSVFLVLIDSRARGHFPVLVYTAEAECVWLWSARGQHAGLHSALLAICSLGLIFEPRSLEQGDKCRQNHNGTVFGITSHIANINIRLIGTGKYKETKYDIWVNICKNLCHGHCEIYDLNLQICMRNKIEIFLSFYMSTFAIYLWFVWKLPYEAKRYITNRSTHLLMNTLVKFQDYLKFTWQLKTFLNLGSFSVVIIFVDLLSQVSEQNARITESIVFHILKMKKSQQLRSFCYYFYCV